MTALGRHRSPTGSVKLSGIAALAAVVKNCGYVIFDCFKKAERGCRYQLTTDMS